VLTLRLQGNTADEIGSRFDHMKKELWPEVIVNEWKWAVVSGLQVLVQAAIVGIYIALHIWRGETLALGAVVAIFQYLVMITQLFYSGMQIYEQLMYQHIDVRGVDQLLDDHAQLAARVITDASRRWREIHIEKLTFTHQEGEDVLHTLRDVSLSVAARQKIALIGQSGSGKTTLLTLMRGLYQADDRRRNIR
jgi:ATP-binding cassette subfamily B protein